MRRTFLALSFTTAMLAASAAAAQAQSRVQVGMLECRGGPSVGLVVGSVNELGCVFRGGGRTDYYVATVRRAGLDIGITGETALAWSVYAPTKRLGRGDLSGNYGGVAGNVSVGVGGGANALVGGSANSIALQPVSIQGQTGINLAVGVAGLELRPGRPVRR